MRFIFSSTVSAGPFAFFAGLGFSAAGVFFFFFVPSMAPRTDSRSLGSFFFLGFFASFCSSSSLSLASSSFSSELASASGAGCIVFYWV